MNFVPEMMNFVSEKMDFALKMVDFFIKIDAAALCLCHLPQGEVYLLCGKIWIFCQKMPTFLLNNDDCILKQCWIYNKKGEGELYLLCELCKGVLFYKTNAGFSTKNAGFCAKYGDCCAKNPGVLC